MLIKNKCIIRLFCGVYPIGLEKTMWSIHSKFDVSFNPPIWITKQDGKKSTLFVNFPKHYGRI